MPGDGALTFRGALLPVPEPRSCLTQPPARRLISSFFERQLRWKPTAELMRGGSNFFPPPAAHRSKSVGDRWCSHLKPVSAPNEWLQSASLRCLPLAERGNGGARHHCKLWGGGPGGGAALGATASWGVCAPQGQECARKAKWRRAVLQPMYAAMCRELCCCADSVRASRATPPLPPQHSATAEMGLTEHVPPGRQLHTNPSCVSLRGILGWRFAATRDE